MYKHIKKIIYLSIISSFFIILSTHYAFAQSETDFNKPDLTIFDLLNLSIEELMEISVINIIEANQNLRAATSIQFTEQDLINNGLYTLQDVLKSNAALSIIYQGYNVMGEQRGIKGNFAQTLLLVNGREMNSLNNANSFINEQFASHNIEKIEIIQGPQALRFGINAFSGVISITTKSSSRNYDAVELHIEGGSKTTGSASVVFGKKIGKSLRLSGSLRFTTTNENNNSNYYADSAKYSAGFSPFAQQINNQQNKYKNANNSMPVTLRLKYNNFYAGLDYYNFYTENKGYQYINFNNNKINFENRQFGLYYAGWEQRINNKHLFIAEYQHYNENIRSKIQRYDINSTAFDSIFKDTTTSLMPLNQNVINNNFTIELPQNKGSNIDKMFTYLNLFVNNNLCLHIGYNIQKSSVLNTDGFYRFPYSNLANSNTDSTNLFTPLKYSSTKQSVFFQAEKSFFHSKLITTAGFRFTNNSLYGNAINYSLGATFNPIPATFIKLYFNNGISEPTIYELINEDTKQKNKFLKPAVINNIECNIIHNFSPVFVASFTVFNSWLYNSILRLNNVSFYNSNSTYNINGFESNFNYKTRRINSSIGFNYTHSSNNSELYTFRTHANLTYRITPAYRINANFNYYPAIEAAYGNPNIPDIKKNQFKDASIINLTFSTKAFAIKTKYTLQTMLTCNNVFNTTLYQPNINQSGTTQFMHNKRTLLAKIILKYN